MSSDKCINKEGEVKKKKAVGVRKKSLSKKSIEQSIVSTSDGEAKAAPIVILEF